MRQFARICDAIARLWDVIDSSSMARLISSEVSTWLVSSCSSRAMRLRSCFLRVDDLAGAMRLARRSASSIILKVLASWSACGSTPVSGARKERSPACTRCITFPRSIMGRKAIWSTTKLSATLTSQPTATKMTRDGSVARTLLSWVASHVPPVAPTKMMTLLAIKTL